MHKRILSADALRLALVVDDSSVTELRKGRCEGFVKQQAVTYPKIPLTINSEFSAVVNP